MFVHGHASQECSTAHQFAIIGRVAQAVPGMTPLSTTDVKEGRVRRRGCLTPDNNELDEVGERFVHSGFCHLASLIETRQLPSLDIALTGVADASALFVRQLTRKHGGDDSFPSHSLLPPNLFHSQPAHRWTRCSGEVLRHSHASFGSRNQ